MNGLISVVEKPNKFYSNSCQENFDVFQKNSGCDVRTLVGGAVTVTTVVVRGQMH